VRIKRAGADALREPIGHLAIAERPDPGVGESGQSGHPGIELEPRRVG
jgi:hypothetical protein